MVTVKCRKTRWGIVGKYGLYIGQWQSRKDAIAAHVYETRHIDEKPTSQFVFGGALDELQRRRWDRCKRNGDRAVKLQISWAE